VLLEDDETSVSSAYAGRVTHAENGSSGRWKGLLTGLLVGGVLASGAWWFVHLRQGENIDRLLDAPVL